MTGTELSSNLSLRLEDPGESIFTTSAKVDAINIAQKTVVNMLHNGYLTELEGSVDSSGGLTSSSLFTDTVKIAFSSLNISPIRGGVIGVKDKTNEKWCTMIEVGDVKKLENSYLAGDTSNPVAWVFQEKVFIKPESCTNLVVLYIAPPVDYVSTQSDDSVGGMGRECELNPALQEIVLDFAESQLWRMDAKPDRAQTSYNNALAMIKTLNDRYIIDGPQGIGTKGR